MVQTLSVSIPALYTQIRNDPPGFILDAQKLSAKQKRRSVTAPRRRYADHETLQFPEIVNANVNNMRREICREAEERTLRGLHGREVKMSLYFFANRPFFPLALPCMQTFVNFLLVPLRKPTFRNEPTFLTLPHILKHKAKPFHPQNIYDKCCLRKGNSNFSLREVFDGFPKVLPNIRRRLNVLMLFLQYVILWI